MRSLPGLQTVVPDRLLDPIDKHSYSTLDRRWSTKDTSPGLSEQGEGRRARKKLAYGRASHSFAVACGLCSSHRYVRPQGPYSGEAAEPRVSSTYRSS